MSNLRRNLISNESGRRRVFRSVCRSWFVISYVSSYWLFVVSYVLSSYWLLVVIYVSDVCYWFWYVFRYISCWFVFGIVLLFYWFNVWRLNNIRTTLNSVSIFRWFISLKIICLQRLLCMCYDLCSLWRKILFYFLWFVIGVCLTLDILSDWFNIGLILS